MRAAAHLRALGGRRPVAVAFVTLVAFAAVAGVTHVNLADSDQPPLPDATVSIAANEAVRPVPRSFLGLSTEYRALPIYATHLHLFERAISLLHVQGSGPLILRVGGDSADSAIWDPNGRALPPWAFAVRRRWLSVLSRLIRHNRLRVILDLNLITGTPADAAAFAAAAEARLPRRSIIGFEIGNETDIYRHSAWAAQTDGWLIGRESLPAAVTPYEYARDFRAYARALNGVAPRVPLLGPALADPHPHAHWIAVLLASRAPQLGTVSAHRYVFPGCVRPGSPHYPTIARLLSPMAGAGMAQSLAGVITDAHRAGLPFRLTELNSVNCGGKAGVSNTFATALWAPQALFELLRAGVDGINVHIRADTINAPFKLTSAGLVARPLLYGLLTFVRTLGSDPKLVATNLQARSSFWLHAWAVRTGGRLNVLLVNEGRRTVRVRLSLPARGSATVQRLLAPSVRSQSGVTLDEQWIGHNGRWHGTPADDAIVATKRGYTVIVPKLSSAILSVRLKPGALTRELARTL